VAADDPRAGLRGGKCARYSQGLPRSTVLACYASYMLLKQDFHHLKFEAPDNFTG
jgi:hypothetical protein